MTRGPRIRTVLRAGAPVLVVALATAAGCDPTAPPVVGAWTQRETGVGATFLDAAFGRDTFVLVGLHGTVARSVDGTTWTSPDPGFESHISGLTFSDHFGRFIATTHDDTGLGRTIATSVDGRAWTRHRTPRPEPLREIACAGGLCVAVGDEGAVLRSRDLVVWEDVSFTKGGFRWISVIHADGVFVVTGGREQVAWSADGRAWALGRIPITLALDPDCVPPAPRCNDIDDVTRTAEGYVAVSHPAPGVWLSPDLEQWEHRETGLPVLEQAARGLWTTLSAGGITLVGGGGGKLAASYDRGRTWETLEAGFEGDGIWAMVYGNGTYIVAGESGRVATARLR